MSWSGLGGRLREALVARSIPVYAPVMRSIVPLFLAIALSAGCASLADDLRRTETAYSQAQYQRAAIWLVDLERYTAQMDTDVRARFFFMRGMTAYHLGQQGDALHYLALAREVAGDDATALRSRWRQTLTDTLGELEGSTPAPEASEDQNVDGES